MGPLLLLAIPVHGQSSFDELKQEVAQLKQEHKEGNAKFLADFFSQLETASASPEAALDLYKTAGGKMPDAAPVQSKYEHETPDERADREARDQANQTNLALVAQLHCGLMKFGALFVVQPKRPGLHDDWIAWLKNAPQIYLQIKPPAPPPAQDDSGGDSGGRHKQPHATATPPTSVAMDFKATSLHDSIIGNYLGFHGWGDKDQGTWSVGGLPELFRAEILEPLRGHPNDDTLAAWDVYISMKNADEPDQDKWNSVDYPPLALDRACDDYAITPSVEKLQAAEAIISQNSDHPRYDEMMAKLDKLMADYAARHPGAPLVKPISAPSNPGETVTETTQGDTTVVTTTHASPTPATNAPPAQGQ